MKVELKRRVDGAERISVRNGSGPDRTDPAVRTRRHDGRTTENAQ
ncbi:hypothetical protein [Burkholderia sp. FERM BP-3421]|jgi:hypothetical protein|nr:hypothetical protein [Burkholderia sp. FERM BP-3421]